MTALDSPAVGRGTLPTDPGSAGLGLRSPVFLLQSHGSEMARAVEALIHYLGQVALCPITQRHFAFQFSLLVFFFIHSFIHSLIFIFIFLRKVVLHLIM